MYGSVALETMGRLSHVVPYNHIYRISGIGGECPWTGNANANLNTWMLIFACGPLQSWINTPTLLPEFGITPWRYLDSCNKSSTTLNSAISAQYDTPLEINGGEYFGIFAKGPFLQASSDKTITFWYEDINV